MTAVAATTAAAAALARFTAGVALAEGVRLELRSVVDVRP